MSEPPDYIFFQAHAGLLNSVCCPSLSAGGLMAINLCLLTPGALLDIQIIKTSNAMHVNVDPFYDKSG